MRYDFGLDLVYNNSLSMIARLVKRDSIVLEFGPANGRLTKYMAEQLGCKVYLVELDPEAGQQALVHGEDLLIGDIEQYEWLNRYYDIKFDYIIFADVLEHLRDPVQVLTKTKLLLKENGTVLLSVPNVAHNSVAINLLNNKFEYTDIGLLDNTHIHFFTKESLEKMVLEAGFVASKRMATYNEVGNNEIQNSYDSVEGIDTSYWKQRKYGNVYQFIYELKGGTEYVDSLINYIDHHKLSYEIKFYLDNGCGYHEENVRAYKIEEFGKELQYEIDILETDLELCVQLAEGCCIVESVSCGFETDKSDDLMIYNRSNLDALEGGQYYFFNGPATLYYCLPRKTGKLLFKVKYVTVDRKEINCRYDTMIKVKKGYMEQ